MASGSTGVVGAAGTSGQIVQGGDLGVLPTKVPKMISQQGNANPTDQASMSGKGAQFIYAAATMANILCSNLSQTQINLLANFLSVVTTCVYAVLTVENPTDVLEQ